MRLGFRLANRLFPLGQPEIASLSGLDTSLGFPGITLVEVLPPEGCLPTGNFCPELPQQEFISVQLPEPDIYASLVPSQEQFEAPEVVSLFEPLRLSGKAGKDYSQKEIPAKDEFQLPLIDLQEKCKHGSPKALCDYCSDEFAPKTRYDIAKRKKIPEVNVFDLIFPILQPALGDNFDNAISFPPNDSLYPFQREGVRFLVEHESVLLADEMGVGKSIQAIVALRVLFRTNRSKNTLIVCPKSVLFDWERKLWKWAPELRLTIIRGPKPARQIAWITPSHLYLVSYDTLREDLDDLPNKQFDTIVLDEVQRIKNPETGIAKAVRGIVARIRWGLSGTPLENRIEDIVAIFAYLKPGLLKYDDAVSPRKVREAIKPFFLRRKLSDVKDVFGLGDKIADEVWLELAPDQRSAYDRAYEEHKRELDTQGNAVTITHILALISHLKQICNRDPITGESCKFDYLKDTLEHNIDSDEKALIFSQYPEKTLPFLRSELEEYQPALYSGKLSDKQRDEIVEKFESDEHRLLLMSVKAGGLGLTITRANHIFHLDLWWNPAVAEQAEGRAYRHGQTKTVYVTTLYTVNTIEQAIYDKLEEKRQLFKFVIDDLSDTSLTKRLSEEELFSLFGLQKGQKVQSEKYAESIVTEKTLVTISPLQFEELISNLCTAIGYYVRTTKRTHDGGVDLFAKRPTDAGEDSIIVQCKHYPSGVVGVPQVRELYGVLSSRQEIARAILITSGRFSQDAIAFATNKNLKLIGNTELLGLLHKYKIRLPK